MKKTVIVAIGFLLTAALSASGFAEPVRADGAGKAQKTQKGTSVHEQYKKRVEVKKRAAEMRKTAIAQQKVSGK